MLLLLDDGRRKTIEEPIRVIRIIGNGRDGPFCVWFNT